MLDHPNIVNLVEVIDDPNTDHFYMGMFYSSLLSLQNVLYFAILSQGYEYLKIDTLDYLDFKWFYFCSVLEFVEGKWVCEGSGPPGGLGETKARKYLRDIVSGLMYLHAHVWSWKSTYQFDFDSWMIYHLFA